MRISDMALAAALAGLAAAPGHSGEKGAMRVPAADLRAVYLACEARAQSGRLGEGEIARCSEAYEALKARDFGGDWQRLRVWALIAAGGMS